MAVSETARLIASLELKDLFTKQVDNATKSLGKLDKGLDSTQSRAYKAGTQIGTGIKRGAAIAVGAVSLLAANVALGVKSLEGVEKVTTQTNAVLKSTKGVAGQTAQGIRDMANKFESLNATMDDTAIQSGENVLLTFTNIRQKAFKPAIQAALDLSTAMGQDLQTSVVQIGKALNDPAKGLTSLQRIGVTFSAKQKEQIKGFLKQNDTYRAQQVILKELNKEFGGSFIGQGQTTAGKFAKVRDAVDDLQRALATALLPALGKVATAISTELAKPEVVAAVSKLGQNIAGLFSDQNLATAAGAVQGFIKTVVAAAPILEASAKATLGFVQAAVGVFEKLPDPIKGLLVGGFALNKLTGGLVTNIGGALIDLVGKSRGATPLNPVFVSDVTKGAGAVADIAGGAAKGGLAALAGGVVALLGVGAVEIAIAGVAGDFLKKNIPGWGTPQGAAQVGPVVIGGESESQRLHRIAQEQKAADDLAKAAAAAANLSPQQRNNVQPGAILDRGGREQGFNVLAGKIRDDANFIADVMRSIASRQEKAIETLRHSSDPKAILGALKDIEEITITAGHGNLQTAQREAAAIRRQLAHTHDPTLQAALRKALHDVEGKIPGREYAQRQIAKADAILRSGRSVEDKIRGLQAIENDLKNHKLPGQTKALQAKIDALKAAEVAAQNRTTQALRDKKAQVVIQNQIDAVAKIDSKVLGREVRRVSRLYAIPI